MKVMWLVRVLRRSDETGKTMTQEFRVKGLENVLELVSEMQEGEWKIVKIWIDRWKE